SVSQSISSRYRKDDAARLSSFVHCRAPAYVPGRERPRLREVSLRCRLAGYELLDLCEQLLPRRVDVVRPLRAEQFAQRVCDHAEEGDEEIARRAVGIMRDHLARNHAEFAAALTCEIQQRLDGEGEHRSLHEVAAFAAKHRNCLGMSAMQAL